MINRNRINKGSDNFKKLSTFKKYQKTLQSNKFTKFYQKVLIFLTPKNTMDPKQTLKNIQKIFWRAKI